MKEYLKPPLMVTVNVYLARRMKNSVFVRKAPFDPAAGLFSVFIKLVKIFHNHLTFSIPFSFIIYEEEAIESGDFL